MDLKTDYGAYNVEDFAQEGEAMKELTVTITLYEYRNLISKVVYNEKNIEYLQEENEKLKKQTEQIKSQIKTEAVKEFAERLKESKKQYEGTLAGCTFTMTELDNLVKEIVGES